MSTFYPAFLAPFREFLAKVKGQKVAILGHLRPDGDCIGSQVAFCRVLNELGCAAVAVNPDAIPRNLQGFLGDTPFLPAEGFDGRDYLAINVDCADVVRVGKVLRGQFPRISANIDHHISNTRYAQMNLVGHESSATAEILTGLFYDAHISIDPVAAQALYVGIATDTGQFRFPSTSLRVFEFCCRLLHAGADPAAAASDLYEQESPQKLKLLERFLRSLRFECDNRACIGLLEEGVYAETGTSREDAEGLVDYARSISGVEIGVLVEENKGYIKGSFRAKDPIHRVDLLAGEFEGGGHACAAGFNTSARLTEFYPSLVERLEQHFIAMGRQRRRRAG